MRLHFFFMVLGLIGPDITLCEPRNQSIHPNPSIHVSSTSTCISLSTFTAAGSAPVAGVYAGDDGVLEHDLSALLVGILTDFALANDPRQLRLCVDLQGSLFPSEPVAHSPQTPHSNNPVGTSSLLAEPLTKSVTTTDYYVYVSYSEDTASNTTACSSPNGDCNFRSAVAYCESLLLLEGLTCVIDMPELGAIFIDPSIGQISVRSTAAGTLIIEGNGCVLSSESQSSTTPRLLFLDNVPALYFFVHNMTLHKFGNADANGGVIYLSELRYVAITHVVFSDSIGYNGGGLYIDNTDDVIISDCVFQNVTGWYGAGISLFAYTVNAIISRCIFIDTHAIWQGGALTLFSNSDRTTIIDCSFVRTTAVNSGGALFAYSASDYLFIINCTFLSTHSMDMGGAITFFNGNVLSQILDSTFIGTTAGKFGGAIYFGDANKLALFARCVFNDTDAGIDGGAIYLLSTNEKTTISDCDFIDNTAGKGGGALYLHDNNPSLIVKDSWFRGCRTGNDGGAIFMLSYNNEAIIDGCHFLSTSAFQHGGAIVLYDNNYLVTISKSSFANTSAGLDGGAIYLYDSNDGIEILLSTFIGSTAFGSGGAIHIFASGDSAVISSVVFIDNISEEGGAVFIGNGNGNIKFRDSIFSNNTALVLNGGAVLLSNKNIDVRFEKCIFGGNIAAYGGGIAAVSSNTGVVVDNCTFHDNAALSAGSIYTKHLSSIFKNS